MPIAGETPAGPGDMTQSDVESEGIAEETITDTLFDLFAQDEAPIEQNTMPPTRAVRAKAKGRGKRRAKAAAR